MHKKPFRRFITLLVAAGLSVATSGCFLLTLSGVATEIDGSLIVRAENNGILATCVDPLEPFANIECTYFITDSNGVPSSVTSSADLISEFGILGVIIDPLILQIPGNATNITATYDDGGANVGNLDIQSGFKAIPVDTYRHLMAEPGQQFVIAELPDGVPFDGIQFQFGLSFEMPAGSTPPVDVKPLLSAKFEDGFGTVAFYSPLLPCTIHMTQVAAISIPGGTDLVDIPMDNVPQGCNGEQYLYLGFGVFPCDFDQDDDVDHDDLRIQASVRNAPAVVGDRMDANTDGYVDLNDVRRCALTCTRKGCATESTIKSSQLSARKVQGDAS